MFPIVYRGHNVRSPELTPKAAFEIYFTGNRKAFYPGEDINGIVRFLGSNKINSSITVQGILVKIKCEGQINHGSSSSDQFFKRTYFFKELYVYGNGRALVEIPKRGSKYPFKFHLPPENACPQTYHGLFGSVTCEIEVSLKASISIPSLSQRVNLHSTVDLNNLNIDSVRKPIEQLKTDSGFFSFLGSKKEAIHVYIIISKGGFVPGELILFRMEIDNASKKPISGTRVELVQKAKFTAQSISKTSSKTIGLVAGPVLDQNHFQAWEGSIETPEIPPTTGNDPVGCIKLSYKLKFVIETGPMCSDVRSEVPIVIGTIPLVTSFSEQEKHRSYIKDLNQQTGLAAAKTSSISTHLDLATSRKPTRSFSLNRLPDYVTALQDVKLYPDAGDIPPPNYEDVVEEEDEGNEN